MLAVSPRGGRLVWYRVLPPVVLVVDIPREVGRLLGVPGRSYWYWLGLSPRGGRLLVLVRITAMRLPASTRWPTGTVLAMTLCSGRRQISASLHEVADRALTLVLDLCLISIFIFVVFLDLVGQSRGDQSNAEYVGV